MKKYLNHTHNPSETVLLGILVVSTLLFPKAGINSNGIPITVNLSLVLVVTFLYFFYFFGQIKVASLIVLSFLIPWFFLVSERSNSLAESRTLKFGAIYWLMIVPFFWIATANLARNNRRVSPRLVIYSTFAATFFGLGQYVFGLSFLNVPGVTIALGDFYERKNLVLFNSTASYGTKIPSTFQGGNIWGQCSALILIWIIVFQVWNIFNHKIVKALVILAPLTGILLSFSRTALVAASFTIGAYAMLSSRFRLRILGGFMLIFFSLLIFQPISLERYSIKSLTDSAGRTSQWQKGFENFSLLDWLIGRSTITPGTTYNMEGLFGLFGQVGVFGFLLLSMIWFQVFIGKSRWIGLCMFICIFLDSTYVSPPLLLIPGILNIATGFQNRRSELGFSRN